MEKIKILVCTLKKGDFNHDNVYIPIQGGKAISDVNLGIQGDDTGDNISEKNKRYCESSVLYWAWKNLKDVEYIGLAHYRRLYNLKISDENIDKLMKGKDFLLIKPVILPTSNADKFERTVCTEDWCILLDTILELYPGYKKSIVDYFYRNKFIPYSMFITKRNELDNYCKFLYDILFCVENRLCSFKYARMNRSLAYMGEWLLGLYCYHNNFRIKYVKVDNNQIRSKYHKITWMVDIKNHITFFLWNLQTKRIVDNAAIVGLEQDGICLPHLERLIKEYR